MYTATLSHKGFINISNVDIAIKQSSDIGNSMLLNFDDSQTTLYVDTKPLEMLCSVITQRFFKFFNVDIGSK